MTHPAISSSEFPPPKADEPPIHAAARVGDAAAIRRLVQAGADINHVFDMADEHTEDSLATPLMVAAGSGEGATVETVQLLLDLGADPAVRTDSGSAAIYACTGIGWDYRPGGDAARLRLLLECGSPLPEHPESRNRLLCKTAKTGDADRVRLLLEREFDVRGYWDATETRERAEQVNAMVAKYRAEHPNPYAPLDPKTRAQFDECAREAEQEYVESLCSAPDASDIPLFCAAESGNADCVRLLLAAGADALTRDNSRRTAMYQAASLPVIQLLVAAGVPIEDSDEFNFSPLTHAVGGRESALPRIRALVEAGADINGRRDSGYTVFMSAVGSDRHPAVLRLLIALGADPHAVSKHGSNAFHAAIDVNFEANAEESVRDTLGFLKQLGVNIEQKDQGGHTPLARAINHGTGLEVRVLCELGANPNAICQLWRCGQGECAANDLPVLFHAAEAAVHSDTKTESLLRAGADPLAMDADGYSPLEQTIAALCQDAPDYVAAYNAFFDGLGKLRLDGLPMPRTRDDFVQQATPFLRTYIEQFAATIPIDADQQFAAKWREERIGTIVSLSAYEGWTRHQHNLHNSSD